MKYSSISSDTVRVWDYLLELWNARQEDKADSIEQFIFRAKKCPDLQELTPAVLHDFVNKVYVCTPSKSSGHRVQDVNISLARIGFLLLRASFPRRLLTQKKNRTT